MKLPQLISSIKTIMFYETVGVNMQMMHYLIKYMLLCTHFKNRNLNIGWSQILVLLHWYIRVKSFYRGNFGYVYLLLYKYCLWSKKILLTTIKTHKKKHFCHVFRNKMLHKSVNKWHMNKLLCKNLQKVNDSEYEKKPIWENSLVRYV